MRLYPTATAVNLAGAGVSVAAVGLIAGHAAVVAWGAAVVVGVALARAATLLSVARIRAAGFEMLWSESRRRVRVGRGATVTLEAEMRNRDSLAVRFVALRPICSSLLDVKVEPSEGEVPALGKLNVTVTVHAPRVGRHGLFGLALEVRGAPGLFEVPLTFANPFGIEVLPAPYAARLLAPAGGRGRRGLEGARGGPHRGEGLELRELRDRLPGDPFKRIAWRASARRAKLIVREFEQEQRDTVWVVVDAAAELWAGAPGAAPLDLLIDELASVVSRHLRLGDRVGLVVVGARTLAHVGLGRGPAHGARLFEALAFATGTYDHDRSDLDESDVAVRVVEHLRPLDPRGLTDVSRRDLDRLTKRAQQAAARAPFSAVELPTGPTPRERSLRQYLAAFGIDSPPRLDPERAASAAQVLKTLQRLAAERPRPSLVYVASPAPSSTDALALAARALSRRGAALRWLLPHFEPALLAIADGRVESGVVMRAATTRARRDRERGERALRRAGVRVEVARHAPRTLPRPEASRS